MCFISDATSQSDSKGVTPVVFGDTECCFMLSVQLTGVAQVCWASNVGKLCSCRRVPCHVVMNSSWSLPLSTNRRAKTGSVLAIVSKKVMITYDKIWGFPLLFKISEVILVNVAVVCSSLACSQCTDDLMELYQKLQTF